MKKQLLLAAFVGFTTYSAIGQVCTPDPNYVVTNPSGAGISEFDCAVKDQAYEGTATIVIPEKVTVTGVGEVTICQVKVDAIGNMPAKTDGPGGMQIQIAYNGNTFGTGQWVTINPSVDRGCVKLSNTTFTAVYDDTIRVQGAAKVGVGSCAVLIPGDISFDAINQGGLPVHFAVKATQEDCTGPVSIEESISNNSFDVAQNFPNPFTGETQVAFNLPESGKVTFRVVNLVGKVVRETNISGNAGMNYVNVSASDLAAGIYTYSVSHAGKTVTKRMIVK